MVNTVLFGKVKVNLIDCEIEKNKSYLKEDILKIVRDTNKIEYPGIIAEKNRYEYLYHLSDIRGNIVRWLPVNPMDSVMELEAECGAITGALLELSDNVTAYCDCATDAEIIAERYSNCKNLVIYAGDSSLLTGIESTYDWVIVRNPHLLPDAERLAGKKGRVVFITDNRMGMRNLSGVKAAGENEYFTGVEGKSDSGFTFAGLRKILGSTGFSKAQMFYPYPDYRFMKSLYSNSRLPKVGELVDNHFNFESDRLELFSEKEAFDACCEDGSFQYYSNSYLVVLGNPLDVEYARFSNDRAPEYGIFTTIENTPSGKIVRKRPLSDAAHDHIRNLGKYYLKLSEKYEGSGLSVNKCNVLDINGRPSADFEYVEGVELSKVFDRLLKKEDLDGFYSLFDKYTKLVGYNENADIADLDVVFSNILIDGDNWTLIDYEWCKEGSVPIKETAYRAIYCYLLEDKSREKINQDLILEKLILSREAADEIINDEVIFQKRVTGRKLSLGELRERLGIKCVNPIPLVGKIRDDSSVYKVMIYPGKGEGEFSEETAYECKDAYVDEITAKVTAAVFKENSVMRVDPLDAPCLVTIREAKLGEEDFPVDSKKYVLSNGVRIGKNNFVFNTADPNLYFNVDGFIHDEDTFLYLELEVIKLASDTAEAVAKNIKKFL
ncbi:MAG: hypothetical protein J5626_09920, partial [Lachnospiraceae bacterium]|nr:hypothetical protein [Lachnospiraceae bacterium]